MSRYATNRVLWEVAADPVFAEQVRADADTALAGRDLTTVERTALAAGDVRGLFQQGVHPFLLYNYALRLAGGFSMPFVQAYLAQLDGLELGPIET